MRNRLLLPGLLAAALVVGGCSDWPAGPPVTPANQSPQPTPTLAAPSASPAATLPMPSGAQVQFDPSLLSLLPATVGGVAVTGEPQSFAEAVKDPAFVASVSNAAFFVAVSGSDLASGVVAHLRDGVYADKMFSDWRASYDDGACGPAGGALAHAESTIGDRTTFVTTCGGGLRVYHTYLAGKGVVVSMVSVGTQDFGAQLMGAIRG